MKMEKLIMLMGLALLGLGLTTQSIAACNVAGVPQWFYLGTTSPSTNAEFYVMFVTGGGCYVYGPAPVLAGMAAVTMSAKISGKSITVISNGSISVQ